ncbi:uncharacterized protein A4U43_C04F100 [Asparagus officinalis]|uniref:Uncharacterized protein n=1 Tax=Asparagus officinalis TaxID=4686 RepID=A0A5P1EXL3_ASPOF|nr:uncharacterized protein A4U43_C04F100 [Asparagus officinalis]
MKGLLIYEREPWAPNKTQLVGDEQIPEKEEVVAVAEDIYEQAEDIYEQGTNSENITHKNDALLGHPTPRCINIKKKKKKKKKKKREAGGEKQLRGRD